MNNYDHHLQLFECLKLAQSAQYDYHGQIMQGGTPAAVIARAKAYAEFVFGEVKDAETSEVA